MSFYSCSDDSDSDDWATDNPSMPAGVPPPIIKPVGPLSANNMYQATLSNQNSNYNSYQNSSYNNNHSYNTYNGYQTPHLYSTLSQPSSYIYQEPLQQTAPPNISTKINKLSPSLSVSSTQPHFGYYQSHLNLNNSNPANPSKTQSNPPLNYYGFNTSSNNNNYQNYSTTSHNSNQYPLTQSNNKKSILKNSPLTFPDWNKNNNSTTTFTNAQNKKFINILPAKNNQIKLLEKLQNIDEKEDNIIPIFKYKVLKTQTQPKKKSLFMLNQEDNQILTKIINIQESKEQNVKVDKKIKNNLPSIFASQSDSQKNESKQKYKTSKIEILNIQQQSLSSQNSLQKNKKDDSIYQNSQNFKSQELILPQKNKNIKIISNENIHQLQGSNYNLQKKQTAIEQKNIFQNEPHNKFILQSKKDVSQSQNKNLLEIIKNLSEALNQSTHNLTLALSGNLTQKELNKNIENISQKSAKNNNLQHKQKKQSVNLTKTKTEKAHILSSDGYKISLLIGFDISIKIKFVQLNQKQKQQNLSKANQKPISFIIVTQIQRLDSEAKQIHRQIEIGTGIAFQLLQIQQKQDKNHEWLIQNLQKSEYLFIYSGDRQKKISQISQHQNIISGQEQQEKLPESKDSVESKRQKLQNKILKKVSDILTLRSIYSKSKMSSKSHKLIQQMQNNQQVWILLEQTFEELNDHLQLIKNEANKKNN